MELTLLLIITAIFMSCVECGEKQKPCCVPAVFQCKMDVTGGLVNIQNNDLEFYDVIMLHFTMKMLFSKYLIVE